MFVGPAAQAKSSSSGVVGWFGQSLAAIKRRGRSTDDPDQDNTLRLANSTAAYGDSSQQRSNPGSNFSEPLPAASSSEPTPVNNTAGASQSSAQHAQQAGPVQKPQVKRKPGRPRKVLPAATADAHATSSSNQLPAGAALFSHDSSKAASPSSLQNSDLNLNSNAAASSQRRVPPASSTFDAAPQSPDDQTPGADTDAADLPAGALIPQAGQKPASVAIDLNKLLKSRGSQQVRDVKRSGQGSTTAATHPIPASGPAAASAGGGGAAGSGGAAAAAGHSHASGEANTEAPAASQAAQASTDPAAAATAQLNAAIAPAGQKGAKRGRPSKHAKLDAQNRALQPTVPAAATATAADTSTTQPVAAANGGSAPGDKAEAVAPSSVATAAAQNPSAGVETLASDAVRMQSEAATTSGPAGAAGGGDAGADNDGVAGGGDETFSSDAVRLHSASGTTAGPVGAVSGGDDGGVSGTSAALGQQGSHSEAALGEQGRGQSGGKDLPFAILLEGTSGKASNSSF